jgi:hypothetical protein
MTVIFRFSGDFPAYSLLYALSAMSDYEETSPGPIHTVCNYSPVYKHFLRHTDGSTEPYQYVDYCESWLQETIKRVWYGWDQLYCDSKGISWTFYHHL